MDVISEGNKECAVTRRAPIGRFPLNFKVKDGKGPKMQKLRGRFSWTRNGKGNVLEGSKVLPSSRNSEEAGVVRAS